MSNYHNVLPMAVEAAQKLASDLVAKAIEDAAREGYARGLAERPYEPSVLRNAFKRADKLLEEIESSGRRDATLDEIVSFLRGHGGETVVDVETLTIDTDGVDDALRTLQSEVDSLREVLQEMRNRLDVRTEDADEDADDSDVE